MVKGWASKLGRAVGLTRGDAEHESADLAALLEDYPPLVLPHVGSASGLSAGQAEENLAAWVAAVPTRLDALATLLQHQSLELPDSLARADPLGLSDRLHAWAGTAWGGLASRISGQPRRRWLANERQGDAISFSMTADVTMLLGELIKARRPGLQWAVDLDVENRQDDMPSANRVVLAGQWIPDPSRTARLDLDEVVTARLLKPDSMAQRFENTWRHTMQAAIDGLYEGAGVVVEPALAPGDSRPM